MGRVNEDFARRQAARCIPATEAAQPITPIPGEDGVDQGKYSILAFSPKQRPLDYIDLLPDEEEDEDYWRSGVRHLQFEDE